MARVENLRRICYRGAPKRPSWAAEHLVRDPVRGHRKPDVRPGTSNWRVPGDFVGPLGLFAAFRTGDNKPLMLTPTAMTIARGGQNSPSLNNSRESPERPIDKGDTVFDRKHRQLAAYGEVRERKGEFSERCVGI